MHLPHHSAAILLGTLFAYPFHARLRETFGIVPAAWLLSPDFHARRAAVKQVHELFCGKPEDLVTFLAARPYIPDIATHLRTHPFEPWYLEDWTPTSPGFSQFLSLAIDFGKIPTGIYGTVQHRILTSRPPLVTSHKAPAEPTQASRFFFFPLDSSSTLESSSLASCVSFQSLLADRSFPKKAERRALYIERELAPKTWLTLRRRIQLAIAFAHYTQADEILSDQPEDADALLEAITAPRAFDAPENLCV